MLSLMLFGTLDAKSLHNYPYPALMEGYDVPLDQVDREEIKTKIDSTTLTHMKIKLPLDQRLQLEDGQPMLHLLGLLGQPC